MEKFNYIFRMLSSYMPKIGPMDIIEMVILGLVIYRLVISIKNTRAWVFLKGFIVLLVGYGIADIAEFNVIKLIFQSLFSIVAIFLIVVFQQELKKLIGEIGKRGNIFKLGKKKDKFYKILTDEQIDAIVQACKDMAAVKTGALILIERDIPLKEFSDTGIKVDSNITKQMLVQIFEKNTPLHDGAVIIHNGRIESATCYLPLTKSENVSKSLGTRHRAGIGISEVSDALTVIVSEETGKISTVSNGKINHGISTDDLKNQLVEIQDTNVEILPKNHLTHNWKMKLMVAVGTVIFWATLMTSIDPVISETIKDVPIEILNESVITSNGMSYHITSEDTVDVNVKGKRSIIDNMTEKNLSVFADLKNLSISDATEIIVNCNLQDVEVEPKTKMLNISIENTKEVEYDISVSTRGNLSSSNYIKSIDLNDKSVKIKGPVSKINVIGDVVAKFDISKAHDGSELITNLEIYDRNGNLMDTDDMELSFKEATAKVTMYKTKTVPFTLSVQCIGGNGEITSYLYEKEEIDVAADDLTLETVTGIFMEIPITIDESVETSEFVKVINLEDFMPNDVFLAERENKLSINLQYEKYVEKNIEINNIEIENKNNHLEYVVSPVTVRVKGLQKIIDNLTLSAKVDASGLDVGTHSINVITDNQYIVGEYKTNITISEESR